MMNNLNSCDFKYSLLGSVVLILISFLTSAIPYTNAAPHIRTVITLVLLLGAVSITTYILVRKHHSFACVILRFGVIIVTFIALFLLGSQSRLFYALYNFISPYQSATSNNVSGLLWMFSFVAVLFTCIIVSFLILLVSVFKKQHKTGDG